MEELVNRLSGIDMNDVTRDDQNLITKFLSEIDNDYQSDIVLKLFCGYTGTLYLSDYSKERGEVSILGSRNSKGRETYTVHINPVYKSLTCNCKDFLFRSNKYGTVCKHITFLVCKVGYILDPHYFKTKRLNQKQYDRLVNILDNNVIWKNRFFSVKDVNKEFESNVNFEENDTCPICYETYGDIKQNVACPQCKNYIHKKCMDIWLETNQNCVYCRSYAWKNYVSDISKI
jgi:hypothetical protein